MKIITKKGGLRFYRKRKTFGGRCAVVSAERAISTRKPIHRRSFEDQVHALHFLFLKKQRQVTLSLGNRAAGM